MPTSSLTTSGSIGAAQFTATETITADGTISHQASIPGGFSGTIDSYDSLNTQWSLTLTGNNFAANDLIQVYWNSLGSRRYGMKVVSVSGATVVIGNDGTNGGGDLLPTTGFPVNVDAVTKVQDFDTDFDGDLIKSIAMLLPVKGVARYFGTTGLPLLTVDLEAGVLWRWSTNSAFANPLAGKVVDFIRVGHSSTSAQTFTAGLVYDSTP